MTVMCILLLCLITLGYYLQKDYIEFENLLVWTNGQHQSTGVVREKAKERADPTQKYVLSDKYDMDFLKYIDVFDTQQRIVTQNTSDSSDRFEFDPYYNMPKILARWSSKLAARKEMQKETLYEQEKVLDAINCFWKK